MKEQAINRLHRFWYVRLNIWIKRNM